MISRLLLAVLVRDTKLTKPKLNINTRFIHYLVLDIS